MRMLAVVMLLMAVPAAAHEYWPFAPPAPAHTKAGRTQAEWKAQLLREAGAYCRAYPHDWHCNFLPR